MDVELRAVRRDEVAAFVRADEYGFGERWSSDGEQAWVLAELERTVAAIVEDEIVATGRNYTLELTLPGGGIVPAGGVSWISTRPTHRRRGLLTRVMRRLLEESVERGEPVSLLTASEGGIYPRFGYGIATRIATFEMSRSGLELQGPIPDARVRMVEPDEARGVVPGLFDRIRRTRAGTVSRPGAWWLDEWGSRQWIDPNHRFDVLVEIDGVLVGHAMYAVEGRWVEGFTQKVVAVRDLVAASPEAELVLWHYLANIDQTVAVRAWNRPLDDALPWMLTDARQVRTTGVRDFLWLRPLDTAALLSSRRYGIDGRLVLAVTDDFLGHAPTVGSFVIEGGPSGAGCERTDAAPALVMGADALGAISLGGVRPSLLARAGRIHASGEALTLADRMFAAEREPYASTWF